MAKTSNNLRIGHHEFAWGTRTYVMGILNITPDSFSGDGLLVNSAQPEKPIEALSEQLMERVRQQAQTYVDQGVDILDVGGESTRPGAQPVTPDEEAARVLPVIKMLSQEFDVLLSIDTYRASVGETALQSGAHIVNDVWGFKVDPELAFVAARHQAPVILMHNRSSWANAEIRERLGGRYVGIPYQELLADIKTDLLESVALAQAAGIPEEHIILDPGIGFGKTVEQNLELLDRLSEIRDLGYPVLLGPSRKSFIGFTLNLPPDQRLEGTAAAVAIGIARGADIVRVHDAAFMMRVVRMSDAIVRRGSRKLRLSGDVMEKNFFGARDILKTSTGEFIYYRLTRLEQDGLLQLSHLPFSIRIMLESLLRQCNEHEITRQDVINLAGWQPKVVERVGLPFKPGRVVMQDFTGVPAVVDLAAMRSAIHRLGGDPKKINPLVPVDLVIDHSVQVDFFATASALTRNLEMEFQRNGERYEFLRWGQRAFSNFRVVPPATGIVHQVNLEYLAQVILTNKNNRKPVAYPDTLVGTDSHTTMINGLGVVGWGVGGIEAEAVMLGQPMDMLIPDVIGFKLYGKLNEGVTATDLTLTVTQMLRKKGVVDKFVEFFGPGLSSMALTDRATIANMAPEYGATIGFFPVDDETLRYLRLSGRSPELIELVERYCKEQNLYRTEDTPDPDFTDTLELDLSSVVPSLAGPKRPQDRVPLSDMKQNFLAALSAPVKDRGYELSPSDQEKLAILGTNGSSMEITHGAVVIAAITSCTNTSNPSVMVAAGLVAKKAIERGLKTKPYVKTSLAPGSRVVTDYLQKAGLLEPLASLGFNIVGYGCTTCIGNSGPLSSEVVKAITGADLVAAAVISGNRNFEGRVHAVVRANYLASPPLVVAYALAGSVMVDLVNEPIGSDSSGSPVFLRDLWPSEGEIQQVIESSLSPEIFQEKYQDVFAGTEIWNSIRSQEQEMFEWDPASTYIQEPPFFMDLTSQVPPLRDITGARALAVLGDSITTDHISPAGSIQADSPAGKFLIANGVQPKDFNSYGTRRGNDRVMTRGTLANIRLKNRLVEGVEGGLTVFMGSYEEPETRMSIYDAAMKYRQLGIPLVILAGKEYGTGSSRDWAAKGTNLLGVKAVIAESFERIHRSNLVGMGVLPLQFKPGDSVDSLGLTGHEIFSITGLSEKLEPQGEVTIRSIRPDGSVLSFDVSVRINTPIEIEYYLNGGILHYVLRNML